MSEDQSHVSLNLSAETVLFSLPAGMLMGAQLCVGVLNAHCSFGVLSGVVLVF